MNALKFWVTPHFNKVQFDLYQNLMLIYQYISGPSEENAASFSHSPGNTLEVVEEERIALQNSTSGSIAENEVNIDKSIAGADTKEKEKLNDVSKFKEEKPRTGPSHNPYSMSPAELVSKAMERHDLYFSKYYQQKLLEMEAELEQEEAVLRAATKELQEKILSIRRHQLSSNFDEEFSRIGDERPFGMVQLLLPSTSELLPGNKKLAKTNKLKYPEIRVRELLPIAESLNLAV